MKKYFLLFILLLITLFLSRYIVLIKPVDELYPMSYVYKSSANEIRKVLIETFSNSKFYGLDCQIGYDSIGRELVHVTEKENRNHFFINWNSWESSGEVSKIYYNLFGRLKLIPSYHIILDSISDMQTKLIIISFPKVKAGLSFSQNHLMPYITSRHVNVLPSTIEEYEILFNIGQKVGEKNMIFIKSSTKNRQ